MELFSIRLKILYTFESGIAQLVERILVDGGGGGGGRARVSKEFQLAHISVPKRLVLYTWIIFACWLSLRFSRICFLRENYRHAKIKPNGL